MIRAVFGLLIAAAVIATPLRRAETPAPAQVEAAPAVVSCFREGRFLDFDPGTCAQIGGIMRPRGPTAREIPRPAPVLGITVTPLPE